MVSLFTGCGGLDLGLEQSERFETVWANDNLAHTMDTFEANFPECTTVFSDIEDVDLSTIPDCDIMVGGFPCQSFSMSGKRAGLGTEGGNLYKHFVAAVAEKKPKMFMAENVKGLLSANDGKAFSTITQAFSEVGYNVIHKLIKFADYGVPQIRERVIIIGIRNDIKGEFEWPVETHLNTHVSSSTALHGVECVFHNNKHTKHSAETIAKLSHIPPGGNFEDLPEGFKVKGLMSNIYKKLNPNLPSPTIIGNGGGGTHGYHWEENRALTNRERARLQSFPDDFVFYGTPAEVRLQIGNSVPPLGARIIGGQLAKFLDNIDKDSMTQIEIDAMSYQTLVHIQHVQKFLNMLIVELLARGEDHDASKLNDPEVAAFAERTTVLSKLDYGSQGYLDELKNLRPTLKHHYESNAHHPEHNENGIDGMNLVDLLEMFCDWKAATLRMKDGNLERSIGINTERFNISPQLVNILKNTIELL